MAKVLLVEDDNNLREIYEARLQAEGYDITSAQDGEQALVVAKDQKPDLIISDVMMPKISGFEMLDILRNTQGLKDTKVIMLTALGQAEDRGRADSLGADRYLVKSQVTLEDIVKAAHELLEDQPEVAAEVPPAVTPTPTSPVPADVPTPEIAVSAPPTDTTAVEVPSPVATPANPVTPEPVTPVTAATDTPTVDATVPDAPTPDTSVPATPLNVSSDTTDEPTEPELNIPGLAGTVEAPAEAAASVPPTPETAAPTTDLPDVPDVSTDSTTPAEQAPAEAAEPVDPTPTEATTTAEEQATVESQIEDFINSSPATTTPVPEATAPDLVSGDVPPSTPEQPPVPTNDEIMQESVDSLIASAEETNAPFTTTEQPTETRIEPAPVAEVVEPPAAEEVPAPVTTPVPSQEVKPSSNDNDAVTIAHKKVLQPINDINAGPDLSELLAREEAKHIADGTSPAAVGAAVTSDNPLTPPTDPATSLPADTPTVKNAPGHTIIPSSTENSIPPTKKDDFDPNNISL